jgi:hypothetical protein
MPYTTKEIVKKHILDHHIGSVIISNEAVQIAASEPTQLQKQMILPSSETVKAKEQNTPVREALSFYLTDEVQLGHPKLIPDSIIVASDSSLGQVFVENIDYHIDYSLGTIRRLTLSAIPTNSEVVIWYQFYRIYQRGVDYDLDYQAGTIRRRSSGAIEAGQWVLIDYTAEYGSLDDTSIENAISEASEQILSFIDESYRESSDRGLVMAETYLTVSNICRIKAMESLSPSRAKASGNDAQSWAAISDMYRKESFNILSRFAAALNSFNSPSKA